MLAFWLPARIVAVLAGQTALDLRPDAGVLAYALGLSVLSCLVFGLAPALHGTKGSVGNALKTGVPMAGSRLPLRNLLLAVQVAVTVVLLAAAALLARAVYDAGMRDHGFSMRDISVVSFEAPSRGYDAARIRASALELTRAVEAAGAGRTVAVTSTEPLGSGNIKGAFRIPGLPEQQSNSVYEVSPGYFDLLGVGVLAGRPLVATDSNKPVVVISETMAKRYWTIPSAVGQRILVDPASGGWNTPGELGDRRRREGRAPDEPRGGRFDHLSTALRARPPARAGPGHGRRRNRRGDRGRGENRIRGCARVSGPSPTTSGRS